MDIYEELGAVARQPQKNVRDNVKESYKNRLLQPDRLWICFQLNQTKFDPHKRPRTYSLISYFSPKSSKREVKETRLEPQTRAAQDLGELLRLKTDRWIDTGTY